MLTTEAAFRKDQRTASKRGHRLDGTLQQRHFAVIASIIAGTTSIQGHTSTKKLTPAQRDWLAVRFMEALSGTNSNFDRARFLKACGVDQ